MDQKPTSRRILAIFVLAFLCLNVGGAFCLTYCSQLILASETASSDDAHLSEHCRQAKREAEEKNRDSSRIDAGEASCCMMPVSMFAAPVEKQTRLADVIVADYTPAIDANYYTFSVPIFVATHTATIPVYRPPPLDRRARRILHSVFRI